MKPLPHQYDGALSGGPAGYATVSAAGLPDIRVQAPADFGGPGDAWSPEHLLVAAVQSCFLLTLRAVAHASKLEFKSLTITSTGTVDRKDGATRFTQIVMRPRLTIASDADRERALRIVEKSEKACLVTASLSTPIVLEPEIQVS